MSTRAIVRVQGTDSGEKQETWSVYCQYDGCWKRIGAIVNHVIGIAIKNDSNLVGGFGTPGRIPNIAIETSGFVVYLVQQLGELSYIGANMTKRNPEVELTAGQTDIEYLYVVTIHSEGVVTLDSYVRNDAERTFLPYIVSAEEREQGEEYIARVFPNDTILFSKDLRRKYGGQT